MAEKSKSFTFLVLIILIIWLWNCHSKINELENQNESYATEIESLQDALNQANENIEDAKASVYSSYEETQDALSNLETVESE